MAKVRVTPDIFRKWSKERRIAWMRNKQNWIDRIQEDIRKDTAELLAIRSQLSRYGVIHRELNKAEDIGAAKPKIADNGYDQCLEPGPDFQIPGRMERIPAKCLLSKGHTTEHYSRVNMDGVLFGIYWKPETKPESVRFLVPGLDKFPNAFCNTSGPVFNPLDGRPSFPVNCTQPVGHEGQHSGRAGTGYFHWDRDPNEPRWDVPLIARCQARSMDTSLQCTLQAGHHPAGLHAFKFGAWS